VDLTGQALAVQALDFEASHVLVMALAPVTYFTVQLLKRRRMKILHWFLEDYRQARYWEKVLPAYTHWFAIQNGPMPSACASAGVRFGYLPTAAGAAPAQSLKEWSSRAYDLVFVGLPSPYRIRTLEALLGSGWSLAVAGLGWEGYSGPLQASVLQGGWVEGAAVRELLSNARVGLHIPYEEPLDRGDCHVSPRVYEVLGAGCALACEDGPLLREAVQEFPVGFFSGAASCRNVIQDLLDKPLNPADQEALCSAVKARHGYRNRFEALAAMAR
jgi:hypothetical protein